MIVRIYPDEPASLAQSAEAIVLETIQFGFESLNSYQVLLVYEVKLLTVTQRNRVQVSNITPDLVAEWLMRRIANPHTVVRFHARSPCSLAQWLEPTTDNRQM